MSVACSNIHALPDVQSSTDNRQLVINQVGIKDLRFPLTFASQHGTQATVATAALSVRLAAESKGTHMSRFISLLHEQEAQPLSLANFPELLQKVAERLETEQAFISLSFPFFVLKTAPVSGLKSYLDYTVSLHGMWQQNNSEIRLELLIPITSLCPCSKKIADYGAHNQRSHVTLSVLLNGDTSIEALIALVEQQASCELYGLLKRNDEKYVTEYAYDHPKFVEDLVRDMATALNQHPAIGAYRIECENFESIHNHSAYAIIERKNSSL
ncbi:MAG: GTP cyclohydrolase FolE2 [bacterium]